MTLTIALPNCMSCGEDRAAGEPHPALGPLCAYCRGEAAGQDGGLRMAALERLDDALSCARRYLPPEAIREAVQAHLDGTRLIELGELSAERAGQARAA